MDEPGTTLEDFDFQPDDVDVVSALTDLKDFLSGSLEAESSSVYINKIAVQFPNVEDQRSFALRLVVHYVGDIHQPLRGTSEVDQMFPQGDMGGNSHKLPADPETGVEDLHAVWDSVIYDFPGYETLPMDDKTWDFYTSHSTEFKLDYPVSPETEEVTDFSKWAHESFQMSETLVYPGFVENQKPGKDYLAKARPAMEERLTLAGVRLADLIIDIYTSLYAAESHFLQ